MKQKKESLAPSSTGQKNYHKYTKNKKYSKSLSTEEPDKFVGIKKFADSIIGRHWLPKTFVVDSDDISVIIVGHETRIEFDGNSNRQHDDLEKKFWKADGNSHENDILISSIDSWCKTNITQKRNSHG